VGRVVLLEDTDEQLVSLNLFLRSMEFRSIVAHDGRD
jgi:hypothetical protein